MKQLRILPIFLVVLFAPCSQPSVADTWSEHTGQSERVAIFQSDADSPSVTAGIPLSAEERAWLARLPVLRIGVDPAAAPVSWIGKEGDAQGLAIDYLHEASRVLGLRTETVVTSDWNDTVRRAAAGEIDLLPAASASNIELGRHFGFTAPYLELPVMIVTRENAFTVNGPEDLNGHRIAANLSQGAVAAAVAPMSSVEVVPVSTTADGLADVAAGKVDAYVGDIATAEVLLRRDYPARLKMAAPSGERAGLSIAVNQRLAPLLPLLDRALAQIPERQSQTIRNTWLRSNYTWGGSWREIARKVGPIGAVVLALLLLITHAYLRLRRETRRREHSEAQLADVTRHMPAVVYRFRYEEDGRIGFVYVGGNPEPIFGVPAETFLHDERSAFARIDARDQSDLMAEVSRAATSLTPIHAEMRIRDVSPERWVASHAVPRRVDGAVEFTGYWIDISERRLQSAQLASAKETAELATRAKSEFLATISHEIRTPMHGVIGMLEMLGLTTLEPAQRRLLGTAEVSAGALLQILDDVLDFSRIEAGQLTVEHRPVNLRELTMGVVELFALQADAKGLVIEHRIDERVGPLVITDGARLRQVLLNLVSNAVKFTAHGKVTVFVDVLDNGTDLQALSMGVTDTGIGIASDDMGRLFAPFTQAESSTTRRFGGSGLGLAISRRLVDLLGGTISMTSEPGIGTRVTISMSLPIAAEGGPNASMPEPIQVCEPIAPPRQATLPLDILVAEDNPTNRELIAAQLDRLGHRHTIVVDGAQALLAATSHAFDVLLTDLQMPERDGYALVRALRENDATLHIIAMTANAMPEERARCLAGGMDGFLAKPVRLDALREALAAITVSDPVWNLEALREDFGGLATLPAMVNRFAAAMQDDFADAAKLRSPGEAATWSHRIRGGLSVFGPSRAATMLERFEGALRGNDPGAALLRLPDIVAMLEAHVAKLVQAAHELTER